VRKIAEAQIRLSEPPAPPERRPVSSDRARNGGGELLSALGNNMALCLQSAAISRRVIHFTAQIHITKY
jgi:hypothetical protein